jgi:photosystem II stability/assembly factor-like uncharacterized protein
MTQSLSSGTRAPTRYSTRWLHIARESPTHDTSDLFVLDAERAWLDIGTTLCSTFDGGASWTRLSTFDHLGSLDFINAQDGWDMEDLGAAMGQDAVAIYRSTDGGRRWFLVARTPSLVGSGVSLGGLTTDCDKNGIVFATPRDGWITEYCNGGSIGFFATHDGGSTWIQQHLPVPSACSDGCGVSPPTFFGSTGFLTVGGASMLFVTHDTGATWTQVPLPVNTSRSWIVQFVDAHHGFVVPGSLEGGATGHVLYTTSDAGVTWTTVHSDIGFDQYETFDFVSPEAGIIWIQARDVLWLSPTYRTSDGGRIWVRFTPTLAMAARRA